MGRWQHLTVQRLMSEIYPQTVVGQLVGRSSRHIGWGRSITVLLPAWHSLGKPRSEAEVGVRASKVWEHLWLHQISGPWGDGGPARWKGWVVWGGRWWSHCGSRWEGYLEDFTWWSRKNKVEGLGTGWVSSVRKIPAIWLSLLTYVKNSKGYKSRQTLLLSCVVAQMTSS